jgi:uncharacterized membrane protein
VTRLPFLDWMRGLAVVVMIQCHVFNSLTRLDQRHSGLYICTQFVGGMAAPLFLFMAGMTSGFLMDRLEQRGLAPLRRWRAAFERAGYILLIAYLFRLSNALFTLPKLNVTDLLKVDILNCMGLAMAFFSLAALWDSARRVRLTTAAAALVAAVAPIVSGLDWSGVPAVLRYYVVPGPDRAQFPFFPCAAYLGFGIAAGSLVKAASDSPEKAAGAAKSRSRMDSLMRWLVLAGMGTLIAAEYFANLPFSLYAASDFWRNSPALIFIRLGIMLATLTAAYLWTEYLAGNGWSWMRSLGKTSLLVYWVHVMLVYGVTAAPLKRSLTPAGSAVAALTVLLLMIALAELRLRYRASVSSPPRKVHPQVVEAPAAASDLA